MVITPTTDKKGCHAGSVEAWWVGLGALPFDGAQSGTHFRILFYLYFSLFEFFFSNAS